MKICTKCKQPIEDGKLFCGYCGGLGEEKKEESIRIVDTNEEAMTEEGSSSDQKQKLVDMDEWKKASPIRELLSNPKIPRVFMILNIIGATILIAVGVALFVSAIDALKNEVLSEVIMLARVRIKFEKLINTVFIGALVLYVLFRLPYVQLYLLISRRNFIKKRLASAEEDDVATESHGECLERLSDEEEDFGGSAFAYLLARDDTKFAKEIFFSLVTIAGKLLEIIFCFVFCSTLIDKILVLNPSVDIAFFLTQPALWGFLICVIVDIFIPNFRDSTLVLEELEKAEIKKKTKKK